MRKLLWALGLLLLLACYLPIQQQAWEQRAQVRGTGQAGFVLPSQFSRVLAVGQKGLVADYLMLKTISFFGERVMFQAQMKETDWDYIVASLEAITDLDPYFKDPYVFAEGLLTWEAGRVEVANRLLERGWRHRPNDWLFPFYLGFNYFYFLKDTPRGAQYLMDASRIEGSPGFLPGLAARLSYMGGRAETGVVFLKGMLLQTSDPKMKAMLTRRLKALEGAAWLENEVARFRERYGRLPRNLEELQLTGGVTSLPEEPYGGRWVLLPSGRVYSTSRFVQGGK